MTPTMRCSDQTPVRHDYTNETRKNGWAVLDFEFLDAGMAKMTAFGLKRDIPNRPLEECYLLPGEEVVISMPDGDVLYEIAKIIYTRDPYDLYHAELKYIQHLTGHRLARQRDPIQSARSLEWGQRYR